MADPVTAHTAFGWVALFASSACAGAINSVAGGGTLLTFPTLIWLGLPSIAANATSTVGLVPGSLAGVWGYRREVHEVRQWLVWLIPSSVIGGIIGAVLLTKTPPAVFDQLVPLLVLGATILFMANGPVSRRVSASLAEGPGRAHGWIVAVCQLFIAVYGGYFGAGIGILMLAALGLLHLGSIHRMNGLKTFAAAAINSVAAALFIVKGLVHWPEALMMAAGSIAGGYLGADTARRLGQRTVRLIVIGIGLASTIALGVQRYLK